MEDLLDNLHGFSVTHHPNTPYAEHPHFSLYKSKPSGSSQHERRKKVLEARRERRYDVLNHLRCIEEDRSSASSDELNEDMEVEQAHKTCYYRPRKYRNFLMLSEWLVDVPEDFWLSTHFVLPCPVGKRSLVVSGRGKTKCYSKSGVLVRHFPSLLPGGCHRNKTGCYSALDCIWSEERKTYYVIDIMVWKNQTLLECDTVFRWEWLKTKLLEDTPEVRVVSKLNPYRFELIPYVDCTRETLEQFMAKEMPFNENLDGLLFYHKESHYTHGPSPLIGWLKAYMLPEILEVPVPDSLMTERPQKYQSLPQHIAYAEQKKEAKRQNREQKMEIAKAEQDGKNQDAKDASAAMDS